MGRPDLSDPSPLPMSLAEARQTISRWLESIDVINLTEERFEAAISSDERLNAAFDIIAASAVEQFSAYVQHGKVKLTRRLPMARVI